VHTEDLLAFRICAITAGRGVQAEARILRTISVLRFAADIGYSSGRLTDDLEHVGWEE
jgi:hypothetical protein